MIACVDVHYAPDKAVAACVLIRDWADAIPVETVVASAPPGAPYQPGQFYRRELPALVAVLRPVRARIHTVVIDGYVWLDAAGSPGLGAHLHRALGGATPVVGVAKSPFKDARFARAVFRGCSSRPLYVTAAGMETGRAAACVRRMHGPFRLPTMLREADRLCRRHARACTACSQAGHGAPADRGR